MFLTPLSYTLLVQTLITYLNALNEAIVDFKSWNLAIGIVFWMIFFGKTSKVFSKQMLFKSHTRLTYPFILGVNMDIGHFYSIFSRSLWSPDYSKIQRIHFPKFKTSLESPRKTSGKWSGDACFWNRPLLAPLFAAFRDDEQRARRTHGAGARVLPPLASNSKWRQTAKRYSTFWRRLAVAQLNIKELFGRSALTPLRSQQSKMNAFGGMFAGYQVSLVTLIRSLMA